MATTTVRPPIPFPRIKVVSIDQLRPRPQAAPAYMSRRLGALRGAAVAFVLQAGVLLLVLAIWSLWKMLH